MKSTEIISMKNTGWILVLLIVAGISRFIPHPYNFTAIGALALFSGTLLKKNRIAYLLPFIVLFISDWIIGFHFSMLPVYACFAFTVFLGEKFGAASQPLRTGLLSVISSVVFFLVTNLPVWYSDLSLYPITINGTLQSYTNGLPFLKNQILGDLFYNFLFFGSFYFIRGRKLQVNY